MIIPSQYTTHQNWEKSRISDTGGMFIVQKLSQEQNLPCYAYFPSGANFARLLQAFPALISERRFRVGENGKFIKSKQTITVPGLPPLLDIELPNSTKINPVSVTVEAGLDLSKVNGVIINTFYELESHPIQVFLQACDPTLHVCRLPLFPRAFI